MQLLTQFYPHSTDRTIVGMCYYLNIGNTVL